MAWYTTGTVQVANGSATVTGSGTAWAGPAVKVGYAFMGPDGNLYEISAVNTSTEITLSKPYSGSNGSGQTYGIIPTQSLNVELHAAMLEVVSLAREKLEVLEKATTDGSKVAFDNSMSITGLFSMGYGSVSAPSVSFDGDSNTGFYRPAADTIAYVAGGLEAMRVTPARNLLVGTQSEPSGSGQIVAQNGIYLGGADSANKLNDYEEGAVSLGNLKINNEGLPGLSNGSITYTKIGRLVFVSVAILDDTVTIPSSGHLTIALPFAAKSGAHSTMSNVSVYAPAAGHNYPDNISCTTDSSKVLLGLDNDLNDRPTFNASSGAFLIRFSFVYQSVS